MPRENLMSLAEACRHVAESRLKQNDWSGLPLPVIGLDLVLEPRYKNKYIEDFRWPECYTEDGTRHTLEEAPAKEPDCTVVNSWWNARFQVEIYAVRNKQGRAEHRIKFRDRLSFTIRTLEAAAVWPVEAEEKALKKLATLIPKASFEQYLLTGHFTEISKRSDLTYLFRKGRPTLALKETDTAFYPLCALCLHPIGYYGDTWAGVMCPTDEVIAHLLMMQGSEEKFWANANQHPIDHPAAGV